jgi:hypothetical protein
VDAVYPLLAASRLTGEQRYADAACGVFDWSDHVSLDDGSWTNEPTTNDWRGITVFGQLAIGESLRHHGTILSSATRERWLARFRKASDYIYEYITIDTGNVNYPASVPAAMAVAAILLEDRKYADLADRRAEECMVFLSEKDKLVYGEHHRRGRSDVTAKGCRAVDIGYNVEETLPNLALYASLTGNDQVMQKVLASAQAHLDLMLPDGAWDNSFGVRNYKWTYWGSRTSDGCQLMCALLARYDARFVSAAYRNTELLESCTHDGLLHGGPHYADHGEPPCVHHTFCHAKALAAAIDCGLPAMHVDINDRACMLPRETATGVRAFADIDTYLVASGSWRATVTGYDWISPPGGHATGGALSLLWHEAAGPLLVSSMEKYQRMEPDNQQLLRNTPDIPLIPRVEIVEDGAAYRSCNDPSATMTVETHSHKITVSSRGNLVDRNGASPKSGKIAYEQTVTFDVDSVAISASILGQRTASFVLPLISPHSESVRKTSNGMEMALTKPNCTVTIASNVSASVMPTGYARIFQHVPGFEAILLTYGLNPPQPVRLQITVDQPS